MESPDALWATLLILLITALCLVWRSSTPFPPHLLKGDDRIVWVTLASKAYDGDSPVLTFELGTNDVPLGHRPGQGVRLTLKREDGSMLSRLYYPISNCSLLGRVVVEDHPTSKSLSSVEISALLDKLNLGSQVGLSGPFGELVYEGSFTFSVSRGRRKKKFETLTFLAYGPEIFPVAQLLLHICEEGLKTTPSLVYCGETETSFLMQDIFMGLAEKKLISLTRISLEPAVDKRICCGEVTPLLLRNSIPAPSKSHFVVMSAPSWQTNSWTDSLLGLGFSPDQIHAY